MKLLFDENLSPKLSRLVADLFPGSMHVRECGLLGRPDDEIWDYARANSFTLVSKDSDFQQRSLLTAILRSWSGFASATAPGPSSDDSSRPENGIFTRLRPTLSSRCWCLLRPDISHAVVKAKHPVNSMLRSKRSSPPPIQFPRKSNCRATLTPA